MPAVTGQVINIKRNIDKIINQVDLLTDDVCNRLPDGIEKKRCFQTVDSIKRLSRDTRDQTDKMYFEVSDRRIKVNDTVWDYMKRELW